MADIEFDIIKQDESKYYLCHIDLKKGNETAIENFTNQETIVYEKIKKEIKEKCDFDVIFYKIGEKCNGWKKRFAKVMVFASVGNYVIEDHQLIQMQLASFK